MCVLTPEEVIRESQTASIVPYDRKKDNGKRLSYKRSHLSIHFSL